MNAYVTTARRTVSQSIAIQMLLLGSVLTVGRMMLVIMWSLFAAYALL